MCDVLFVFLRVIQAMRGAGLLLGYIVIGSVCYSVMVKCLIIFEFHTQSLLDISWRNGFFPTYSRRPYQIGRSFR